MDQGFTQDSITELGEEERKYKSTITVKVLGQIVGEGNNKEGRTTEIMENGFLKTPRENLVLDVTKKKKKKKEIADVNVPGVTEVGGGLAFKKIFVIGNNVDTTYELQHNLNTQDVFITMRENFGDYQKVEFYCVFVDGNKVIVDTGDPIPTDSYVVTIVG